MKIIENKTLKQFDAWFNEEIHFANGYFSDKYSAKRTFQKIMRMKIDFRNFIYQVCNGDANAQKGFSCLLKISYKCPKESYEICKRLLGLRFKEYNFFIQSLFSLYRDYPEYREKISDKFRFYDDL